jgi:hypothetical protein
VPPNVEMRTSIEPLPNARAVLAAETSTCASPVLPTAMFGVVIMKASEILRGELTAATMLLG